MRRLRSRDEVHELQFGLEKNLNLLPGDQINPEDPRRWLLIQREMPVQDPSSGQDRWSIDFVLVDQDATPTFVECKRFMDTRSRREVIGQMLEYAANGSYYWTKDALRTAAELRAAEHGSDLERALEDLRPNEGLGIDELFQRAENNLRHGNVRLVFYLEEAPAELKSIVDFLNKQMERTEVLLVEARQYELDGTIVIVPTLFGYTEEARLAKHVVAASPANSTRKKWNESAFFEEVMSRLGETDAGKIRSFYDYIRQTDMTISWGTGANRGSFSVKIPRICQRSIFTLFTDGQLQLNFGWLNGSEVAEDFRVALRDALVSRFNWAIPQDAIEKWQTVSCEIWLREKDAFLELVTNLVSMSA